MDTYWKTAGYLRLSREDGDKAESDSIANQRKLLEQYIAAHAELRLAAFYQDDGYTGTNFDRPAFRQLEADIAAGRVNCVLVKDLSRFGRDYIEMGRYLERIFPAQGVRFIAVNDHVDSQQGRYDMLLPMKNIFNTQYARDISDKVRSAIHTKQERGEFVGAFASYGYRKDPADHNHLLIDPPAAQVVQRIFDLFEQGYGKIKIAKLLNQEGLPSPSEYKRLSGLRYHNGQRLQQTTYWTYATIHRILQNQMYAGAMEQGRVLRSTMHGKAKARPREDWAVVPDTHDAIITKEQWERVQRLLSRRTRQLRFDTDQSPFAGFLRCGDCGRAMVKTKHAGEFLYSCGSYKRYGPSVCSKHSISHAVLEQLVLDDLNQVITSVPDIRRLAEEADLRAKKSPQTAQDRLETNLERVCRLKKAAYEDYRDGLLSRAEYLEYRADYARQEQELTAQLQLARTEQLPQHQPWLESLLLHGKLTKLDRAVVAEAVSQILVFADDHIEITYAFAAPPSPPPVEAKETEGRFLTSPQAASKEMDIIF